MDKVISLYSRDETDYMTNYVYWILDDNYKPRKEWYDDVVMLPFENIKIPAPAMWDEVLKAEYGDCMVPVIGAAPHDYLFYGNCEEQMRKWIKAKGFDGSIDEFCRVVLKGEIRV